jgi:VIT1/CCC1 family predicted Fe2+/Mn2+ transporter
MANTEVRHAQRWRDRLAELGEQAPRVHTGLREVVLPLIARVGGLRSVTGLIEGGEVQTRIAYLRQAKTLPDVESREIASNIIQEERVHIETASDLHGYAQGTSGARSRTRSANLGEFIRSLILGVNDGLTSNFALMSGVVGAIGVHSHAVVAGIAGMVAGGFAMGTGVYLSTKSQLEVIDHAIAREADLIEYAPEEQREELERTFASKGFTPEETQMLVSRLTSDKQRWLNALVSEHFGPQDTSGPHPIHGGLVTGFGFLLGGAIPVLPFLLGSNNPLLASALLSAVSLFSVGALKSIFTKRSPWRGGVEMAVLGVLSAAVTNGVGHLVGTSL